MSFPQYHEYKDSGVEWLGIVPAHWKVSRLKRNVSLLTEKTNNRSNPIALENIESWSGKFLPTNSEYEGDGVAFQSGDILFGKLRPYLAKVLLTECSGEAVGDFHVLRPKTGVNSRFLQYQLLTRSFIDIVDGSTFGSKMPRASWDFVSGMKVIFPPEDYQIVIARFLDRETEKIDNLIAEQKKLIELLKEKRQATISYAVTKGLDPAVKMKDSDVEWLGGIPQHWGVLPMKWYLKFLTSGSRGWADHYSDSGSLFIRIGNLTRDGIDLDLTDIQKVEVPSGSEGERTKVQCGDVLFSITAYLGSVAVVPEGIEEAYVSQHVALARLNKSKISPEWVAYVVKSIVGKTYLESKGYGGTKVQLNLDDVANLLIPCPPLNEQHIIVGYISRIYDQIEALILESKKSVEILNERRSALISEVVTGKIDVRNFNAV